ncbi:hypothetical protein [Robiginitalea sp.]|uniref:hypothetical protein n=1 Tax=Robiginitalea sp. TaxID=1902411 RepID=UPI003C742004
MLKTLLSFGFVILLNLSLQAQLESYKYILIPKKFDGFKYENQFRTSTQIKYLFTQNGYTAIYEDKIPPDLAEDPCKAVRVVLIDDSSLLATKVKIGLRDCNGVVVYETSEGRSKSKEYEFAYREAIDGAFKDLEELPYSYIPPEAVLESLASETGVQATAVEGSAAAVTAAIADPADVQEDAETISGTAVQIETSAGEEVWYAQATDNGYQLVDSTPKIRMKLVKTAQEDTFIATVDDQAMGMVYKKDGLWWHEFFKDGKTEVRPLKLKF